ncbi:hypothetical protein CDEST_10468 [Colletotrichum destructivum]|uniref:Uncharacterized protein n=1 Tax=Colletotrichum destructivum TaxID=34406 RepID=A0AAX4IPU0_9PEZI|nr:hypothetical protein CDEST_10468 [Colletotrichum destructivum]
MHTYLPKTFIYLKPSPLYVALNTQARRDKQQNTPRVSRVPITRRTPATELPPGGLCPTRPKLQRASNPDAHGETTPTNNVNPARRSPTLPQLSGGNTIVSGMATKTATKQRSRRLECLCRP